MGDVELKFPQWQAPLQALILEFDREKVQEKIREVEALIFERLQQISESNDGHTERIAIFDALSVLRIIKRDRLPDWK
jgi:hypothetical protein